MKIKFQKYNVMLLMAMVFTICYQSLHIIFEHKHSHKIEQSSTKHNKQISEKEDCYVCSFEFASYLIAEVYHFNVFTSKDNFSNLFTFLSKFNTFNFTLPSLRAPPVF